jgi:signal transduction histidine kinase/DNA-binding response OmpR family regulator
MPSRLRRVVSDATRLAAPNRPSSDLPSDIQAKVELLANVSHEIRTPLNGVLGMAHLVLQDQLTGVQRERMEVLKSSAESLLHVLNDLLDFSKMEAGKLTLDPVPFHLADEVGATLKWLALQAQAKGLQLSFFQEPGVPGVVVGDPDRLRQVIVNLVGNAIKFTERGEVVVRVGVLRDNAPAGPHPPLTAYLRFEVEDTGIGIPADKLATIFQPFEQANTSTTRRYGGTGLGLAIAARLAALMGGVVTAGSTPGRGSTFRFMARFELGRLSSRGMPSLPPRFDGLRALVVDSHPLSCAGRVEQLTRWGLRAEAADGPTAAARAVAQTEGRRFGLVLLDVDGPALVPGVVQTLRDRGHAGPIVVCRPQAEAPPAAGVSGVAAFLTKPFKPAELLDALLNALQLTPPTWMIGRCLPAVPPLAAQTLRILLAEDNAVNQMVAAGLLKSVGHTVRIAANGHEALAALAEEPFDAILMDVQMPEMDGFEVTAVLRAAEAAAGTGRHLPVIALTAHAQRADEEECLRRGMDDYIAKPIQPRELYRVLGRFGPQPAVSSLKFEIRNPTAERDAPASDLLVLDAAAFRGRCGGRDDLVRQIARLFLSECPRYVDGLRAALALADAVALRAAAHTLKGAVGNLSATPAYEAARRLEDLAHEGRLDAARPALHTLETELDRLRSAVRDLLADPAANTPRAAGPSPVASHSMSAGSCAVGAGS